ncbi:MAG: gliding motility protein GldB [Flavobacteriales bacterium]|nr:MAG: gliding motility protein GldB [Flavobacteriales bacterium]
MKLYIHKILYLGLIITMIFHLQSCKDKHENRWDIAINSSKSKVKITDISEKYYDTTLSLEDFKKDFPWFQGDEISDEDFVKRRTDSLEVAVYQEAIANIKVPKLEQELSDLFAHIKHYYPKFEQPKVYIFSSALQMVKQTPMIYNPQSNVLFIDISSFMGTKSKFYEGLEEYLKSSMNAENIVVKVAEVIVSNVVPFDKNNQKFIDKLVYQGKKQILLDAFLPNISDELKMNLTKEKYAWSVSNEANIWNFFVENDLVFSADPRLEDRFITEAPFSKFYTEIDRKSSPRVGVFIGWQICKHFLAENPKVNLQDFLKMNATIIFNQSKYNPKN